MAAYNKPQFTGRLVVRTRELLLTSGIDAQSLARKTGLTEAWISRFKNEKCISQDCGRVEALYNALSPIPLDIP